MTELYFYRFVAFWILLAAAFFLGQHYAPRPFEYQRFPITASLADIPPIGHLSASPPAQSMMPLPEYSSPASVSELIGASVGQNPLPRQYPRPAFRAPQADDPFSVAVSSVTARGPRSTPGIGLPSTSGPASLSASYPGMPMKRPNPPLRLSPASVGPDQSIVDEIMNLQQKMGGSQVARILDPVSLGHPIDANAIELNRVNARKVFRQTLTEQSLRPQSGTAPESDQASETPGTAGNLRSIASDLRRFARELETQAPTQSAACVRLADALETPSPQRK